MCYKLLSNYQVFGKDAWFLAYYYYLNAYASKKIFKSSFGTLQLILLNKKKLLLHWNLQFDIFNNYFHKVDKLY